MIAAGIIDPAKVTRSALQNAASIAALFLTTEAVVADKPEKAARRWRRPVRRHGRHGLLSPIRTAEPQRWTRSRGLRAGQRHFRDTRGDMVGAPAGHVDYVRTVSIDGATGPVRGARAGVDRAAAAVPGAAYRPGDGRRRPRRHAAGLLAPARRRARTRRCRGRTAWPATASPTPSGAAAGRSGWPRRSRSSTRRPRPTPGPGRAATTRLAEALDALRPEDAELLRLWAWEQLTPGEIATVLDITANAASIRLHRARERLRDELRKVEEPAGHEESREGRNR